MTSTAAGLMLLRLSPEQLLDMRERAEAERCRRSFVEFVKRAWREVDPAELLWSWHLDALCEHLQAVAEGRIQRLIVNIPPGHAKSMIVGVLYPAWRWAREPWWAVISASREMQLATRDASKARKLIDSDWYQRNFSQDPRVPYPLRWKFSTDQNVKSYYANDALGFRLCLSVGSGTGYRGDALLIDDPLDASEAHSANARKNAITWKTETMSSRFNDMERAEEILIMQRLHEDDLSGYLLKAGGWTHLCLMSEFEPKRRCVTKAKPRPPDELLKPDRKKERLNWLDRTGEIEFWRDPRKKAGDLLFPAKFPRAVLDREKTSKGMGEIAYAGQHQQTPVPADGGLIKRDWLGKHWHHPRAGERVWADVFEGRVRRAYDPTEPLGQQRFIITDATFKKGEKNDRVAIGVFDLLFPDLYLIDFVWGRMGFGATIDGIKGLRSKWNGKGAHLGATIIEARANGEAIIETLKLSVPGILAVDPYGGKEARVSASAPFLQAGNVWLPEAHAQLPDAIEEARGFPKATHDDWIDMLAYGVIYALIGSDVAALKKLCGYR